MGKEKNKEIKESKVLELEEILELAKELKRKGYVYYARMFKPPISEYDVYDLKVHTVEIDKNYFTGCDIKGSKQTFLFNFKDIGKTVFFDREDALKVVKDMEKKYKDIKVCKDKDYEEY